MREPAGALNVPGDRKGDAYARRPRAGPDGAPRGGGKHWLEKLSEVDEERRGFLRLAAKGGITDEELDEELAALEETRLTTERKLGELRQHKQRVEEMERDRDSVLEHYVALAPDALDSLTSEERHQLYKMLRLKVLVAKSGDLEIELAGVPVDGLDDRSSGEEVTSRRAPQGGRTPVLRFRAYLEENGARRIELAES